MIQDADADFHESDPKQLNWAETNFFGFYQAEAHLNVGVYALFRPNLGIVGSTICINSGRSVTHWEADFCDMQASLPIPKPYNLRDYHLGNSLHVQCLVPNRVWQIDYDDGEGNSIDVRYDALMPPFDIHDPQMDPMAAAVHHDNDTGTFAWGTAYNGHFDQTGHFTGRVTVRGTPYEIDCISTMDHSWGPRPERGAPNMCWLHGHFSKDLAIHAICSFDPAPAPSELRLAHGYVLERGEIFGLKAGSGRTVRKSDRNADTVELTVTDRADRTWHLTALGLTTFPWLCWPNMIAFDVLARWECQGLTGYGEIMDFYELPQLCALNGSPAARVLARPAPAAV